MGVAIAFALFALGSILTPVNITGFQRIIGFWKINGPISMKLRPTSLKYGHERTITGSFSLSDLYRVIHRKISRFIAHFGQTHLVCKFNKSWKGEFWYDFNKLLASLPSDIFAHWDEGNSDNGRCLFVKSAIFLLFFFFLLLFVLFIWKSRSQKIEWT